MITLITMADQGFPKLNPKFKPRRAWSSLILALVCAFSIIAIVLVKLMSPLPFDDLGATVATILVCLVFFYMGLSMFLSIRVVKVQPHERLELQRELDQQSNDHKQE